MDSLRVENLMKTDNPILHRILQLLDFHSLENFSLAIADTYLWNSLNISFDLERKLKPWEHYKRQSPLRSYWRYQSYDINYSNFHDGECKCSYCSEIICHLFCWYDWQWYRRIYCFFCRYDCVCPFCYSIKIKYIKRKKLSLYARSSIISTLKYRSHFKRPYTRSRYKFLSCLDKHCPCRYTKNVMTCNMWL